MDLELSDTAQEAARNILRWRHDPLAMVRELLHAEPDAWQAEALAAWADDGDARKRRISLQACAGPGKTATLAWCAWHFLLTRGDKGAHPNALATSIDGDNLRDGLWKELSVWQQRSRLLSEAFVWTKERIFARQHPTSWFLAARTWAKRADVEQLGRTLSGLHSPYIAYFVDESGGIHPAILRSAEQGLSTCRWGKVLQAGNPVSREGMLYLAYATQPHLWTIIAVTGDPDDPKRSSRVDLAWAREQIALYGRDNPWVMAYILGQFPQQAINALLSPEDVHASMQRHLREHDYEWAQRRLGVDVARFGDDRTVIFPRQGLAAFEPAIMRQEDTVAIAARVALAIQRWQPEGIYIDDTGHWGHGVYDNLRASGHSPTPINFAASASDPRNLNMRTEMWLRMAEWVKSGGALPNIPEMVPELTAQTYTFIRGKFALTDKDLVKRLIGHSPDLADALALTFAMAEMPGRAGRTAARSHGHAEDEWDPQAEE